MRRKTSSGVRGATCHLSTKRGHSMIGQTDAQLFFPRSHRQSSTDVRKPSWPGCTCSFPGLYIISTMAFVSLLRANIMPNYLKLSHTRYTVVCVVAAFLT